MPITPRTLTQVNYKNIRGIMMQTFEGVKNNAYNDGNGNPTIGIGLNLSVSTNLEAVVDVLIANQSIDLTQHSRDDIIEAMTFAAEEKYRFLKS